MIFQLDTILNLLLNILFVFKFFILNNSSKSTPHTYLWLIYIYNSLINCTHDRLRIIYLKKDILLVYIRETFPWIYGTFGYVRDYKTNKTTMSLKGHYSHISYSSRIYSTSIYSI